VQTIRITITSADPAKIVLTEGAPRKRDVIAKLALLLKKLQMEKEEGKQ